MRKTLSLVLSIVMVLSLAVVGISAANATEIKTAEEFAAMDPNGNYKLGADIAISTPYGKGETPVVFKGTLDGDGHKVTITDTALFEVLSGTVKNLTIEGSFTSTSTTQAVCGLAYLCNGTATVDNVVNNANMTSAWRVAGLIVNVYWDGVTPPTLKVTNCKNTGTIIHTGDASSMAAGIVSFADRGSLTIENCINTGDVSCETGVAGGIIARTGGNYAKANEYMMNIKNCMNTGNVIGSKKTTNVGGIVGLVRGVTLTVENCTNTGNVKSETNDVAGIVAHGNVTTVNSVSNVGNANIIVKKCLNEGNVETLKGRAAGIVGYNWAGTGAESVTTTTKVMGCVNKGTIKGTTYVSQICAYTNKFENVIEDNIGLGNVEKGADSAYLSFYSFSSANIPVMKGNVLVEGDGTEYFTYTGTKDKTANIIKIADMAADCGLTVKKAADAQAAAAALGTVGYAEPKAPDTGDSMIWVAVIALVSIMGMGVAVKARNN